MLGMIFQKNEYFRMFFYKSLTFGAKILGFNSLLFIKPLYLCYRCYKYVYFNISNMYNTLNIDRA